MKPKLTSPAWSGGGLLLALAFSAWAIFLIHTVGRQQADVAQRVDFVSRLDKLEEAVLDLDRALAEHQENEPPQIADARWHQLAETCRQSLGTLREDDPLVARVQGPLDQLRRRLDQLTERHEKFVRAPAGAPAREVERSAFLKTRAEAVRDLKDAVRRERDHLHELSLDLAGKWRQLITLVVIACGLAVTGSLLLAASQRALTRARGAEGALQKAHDELELRVKERTAALDREVAERMQAEAAARAGETRLRSLLEHGSDVVLLLDPDGTIRFNAPATGRVLGYVGEDFVGRTAFELVHPEDLPAMRDVLAAVAAGAGPIVIQARARHKDESWRWIEGVVTNLLHEPSVGAVVVNYRDVTERRRAEEALRTSEEQFRAIFEMAAAGIVQVDPATGRFLRVNEQFCRITGYAAEELRVLTFPEITHADDRAADLDMFQRILQGDLPHYTLEKRYVRKDGQVIWVQVAAKILRDAAGGPLRTIGVIHDVTARRRVEDELRRAHEDLEGKVRERTAELSAANAALQAEIAERQRTVEALRNSEALYHSLVENLPLCVYRKDAAGRLVFANGRYCETRGMPLEQVFGKTVFDLFPRASAEKYAADDEQVMRTGKQFRDVEEHQTGRGERLFVEVFKTALRDHRGQVVGTQGAFWDVTERKRAEEALAQERQLLRTLINYLPDYIYVKDTASRFVLNNAAHLAVLGGANQQAVLGRTDFDFFATDLAERYFTDDRQVTDEGHTLLDREEHTQDRQGETHWVLTTKVPLRDAEGRVTGLVGISRNITRLKRVEEELRRAHEELEHRVEQRTAELARSNAELARSNAELQQFAYVASHDLQEPLRAVAGCVTLLRERCAVQLDERAAEYMDHAVDGAKRMQALINDLLAYSRVGTSGQPFGAVDCGAILDEALANLRLAVAESAARVTWGRLPTLVADASQLVQVFQNLLSNAIKFRDVRPPAVHVAAAPANGAWHFTVADNGIGMEPQYFERVFRVFQRLHTRRAYPGTGIGLAICKKIIERHGGRIWVESTPGQGSTFHFTLPDRR